MTSSSNLTNDQDFAVLDAIYGTSANDEEDTGVSNNSDTTTANPFRSLAAAGTYHQSLRLEESAVNEHIARECIGSR